jgi:hypothetical protein
MEHVMFNVVQIIQSTYILLLVAQKVALCLHTFAKN